ncbi:MAG: hypothetical protein PHU42_03070 [Patescibacteria group bacterium]|nr:hypothetical protein [Patescibacteria group bacterium]
MITLENIKILFTPQYLFNLYPGYDMKFIVPLLVFFGALILLGLIVFIAARKNKKKKYKVILLAIIYNWFLWVGFVGLFLLAFRYEGIAFISMRLILLLWLLVFIFWGLYILVFYKKGYKKILKEHKQQIEKEKYFRKK